jgi:hypothetical protein
MYVVKKILALSNSHWNIATSPQTRNPNHAIITNAINPASRLITIFLPFCGADNRDRDWADGCNSMRRRLFILIAVFGNRSLTATHGSSNLNGRLT